GAQSVWCSFPTRRSSDLAAQGVAVEFEAEVWGGPVEGLEGIGGADEGGELDGLGPRQVGGVVPQQGGEPGPGVEEQGAHRVALRSEEHTSELQSREKPVC